MSSDGTWVIGTIANGQGKDEAALWNAFKRLAAGCSADEKRALFSGTACRVYGLDLAAAGVEL